MKNVLAVVNSFNRYENYISVIIPFYFHHHHVYTLGTYGSHDNDVDWHAKSIMIKIVENT